jgi:DNA-binding NtrC family response regulator
VTAISVLLVGDECADIERLLHHTRWQVRRTDSAAEAKAMLKCVPVQVVLCQHTLRDGTWSNLLSPAQECDPPAAVVVLSKPDDRTWAEVLSSGAYDLLPFPCTAAELYAIVPMAWRHCMQQEAYHQMGKPMREPS